MHKINGKTPRNISFIVSIKTTLSSRYLKRSLIAQFNSKIKYTRSVILLINYIIVADIHVNLKEM